MIYRLYMEAVGAAVVDLCTPGWAWVVGQVILYQRHQWCCGVQRARRVDMLGVWDMRVMHVGCLG